MRVRRGVTLLETVAATAIIGIAVAAVAPLMHGAIDVHEQSRRTRDGAARAGYVVDKALRLVREAPVDDEGRVGLAAPTSDAIELADGRALRLVGDELRARDTAGAESTLARGVTRFTVRLLDPEGDPVAPGGGDAHSVRLVFEIGGAEYAAACWVRCSPGEV